MTKKYAFLLFIALSSCDLIDYHPYDGRISDKEDKNINTLNILEIENSCSNKDTIRFVFTGDTQRWYDETNDFVKHINRQDSVDFVIHGGDLTDFGIKKEYLLQHEILSKLNVPYIALIGNHDVIGNDYNLPDRSVCFLSDWDGITTTSIGRRILLFPHPPANSYFPRRTYYIQIQPSGPMA